MLPRLLISSYVIEKEIIISFLVFLSNRKFPLELLPLYQRLKFIIRDQPKNDEPGKKEVYPHHKPERLSVGCMQLMAHDSLQPNLVKQVGVY